MFRKINASFLGFLLLLSASSSASSQNLLVNGSWENGLAPWTINGAWIPQNFVVAPNSGAIAVGNIIVPASQNYFVSLRQEFNVPSPIGVGQTVYGTVKAASLIDPRAFARYGLLFEVFNGNTVIAATQDEVGGISLWRDLYVQITIPSNATKLRVTVFGFASLAEVSTNGLALNGIGIFDAAFVTTNLASLPITPPLPPTIQQGMVDGSINNCYVEYKFIYQLSFTCDNTNSTQGPYSAKSTIDMFALPNQDFYASTFQKKDFAYSAGTPIFVTGKVKTNLNPVSTAVAGILVEYFNAANFALGSAQQTLSGVNPWTTLTINGTGSGLMPPAGTTKVRVSAFTFAAQGDTAAHNGTANFDEITVSNVAPPANFAPFSNGGFEAGASGWLEEFGFPGQISTNAHSGSFAYRKTVGIIPGIDYFSRVYRDVPFNSSGTIYPTGTPVYLEGYINTSYNPIVKNKSALELSFVNASGALIGSPVRSKLVAGQTPYRREFVQATTPAGTKWVRVGFTQFARQLDALLGGFADQDDLNFSITTPLPPNPAQTTLLNGNIENGTADWDEPFKAAEVTTTPANVHGGSYALNFTVDSDVLLAINYFAADVQEITLAPSVSTVTFNAWVKPQANPLTTTSGGVALAFLNSSGALVGPILTDVRGGTQNYTQVNITAPKPATATKVLVAGFAFGDAANAIPGDAIYLDDFTFLAQ